jgi:hypothetical protein
MGRMSYRNLLLAGALILIGSVSLSAQAHSVELTWTSSATPGVNYRVYRGPSATGPFVVVGTTTGLIFKDATVVVGTSYVYYVTSYLPVCTANCESVHSVSTSVIIPGMTTICSWTTSTTWTCNSALVGIPSGQSVSSVITSGNTTSTVNGVKP